MKKNNFFKFVFLAYIVLLTFNKYLTIFSIPLYFLPLAILLFNLILCKIKSKSIDRSNILLVIWILFSLIWLLFTPNIQAVKSVGALITNINSIIIIKSYAKMDKSFIKTAFLSIKISSIIIILVSLFEICSGTHLVLLTDSYIRRFANKPLAFYANVNDLSVVLVCNAVILMLDYLSQSEKPKKILDIILLIAMYALVIYDRSLICTFAIPLIVLLSVIFYFTSKTNNKKSLILYMLALLFSAGLFFGIWIGNSGNIEPFTDRFSIWGASLSLSKGHLIFGVGPGQSSVLGIGQAHFLLLEILVEYGIVTFSIVLWYYIKVIRNFFKNLYYKKTPLSQKKNLAVILSFLIVLLVLSICSSSMSKLFLAWACIGICLPFINSEEETKCC